MTIWLKHDWVRAVYYGRMKSICGELFTDEPPSVLQIVEYTEEAGAIPQIITEFATVHLTLAPYPEYDIQAAQFPDDEFDVVVADQVLEHIPHVMKAVKECVRITKVGGILMFGTPWIYPYHAMGEWKDYWRISRDAYAMMFDEFGVETIEIDGWGHKEALVFGSLTDGFGFLSTNRTVEMGLDAKLFDVANNPDYAIEVWAVGRKKAMPHE